jgi:oligosaccharide repeat unit polymerase
VVRQLTSSAALSDVTAPLRRTRGKYFKSTDFAIHLMVYWWLFWLAISFTPLNEFQEPSLASLAQFLLLIASFLLGHIGVKWLCAKNRGRTVKSIGLNYKRVYRALSISALFCLLLLTVSLALAGAFNTSFVEYFTKLRVLDGDLDSADVTGFHFLDVLTKILAFPLTYTIIVTTLAVEVASLRMVLAVCIASFGCYSYLWQVNYPLIHLFWLAVFYVLVDAQRHGQFNRKVLGIGAIICIGLMASAVYRFGGDIIGGLQRYIVGYHLVGFTFYDQQFQNPESILHAHTFGRSSLGFLEQVLQNALNPFDTGFQAASFANSEFNNTALDIGATEPMYFNAFGTVIFSLYRDFNVLGILIGGAVYGAVSTYALYRGHLSWRHGALFYMLASAWMMGMMVSPLESAYFWFVVLALGFLQIANRGVRW